MAVSAKDRMKLMAQAKTLGVTGFRTMSVAELNDAIKSAKAPAKSTRKNVSATTRKPVGKSTRKSVKPQPATAKRAASGAKRGPGRPRKDEAIVKRGPGRPKGSTTKSAPVRKSQGTGKRGRPVGSYQSDADRRATIESQRKARGSNAPGRMLLDRDSIDWSAEWSGAQRGTRAVILKALRRFKGNYQKTIAHLLPQAKDLFGISRDGRKRTKEECEKYLRWQVARVAFDFAVGTGQHKIATNRTNSANGAAAAPKRSTVRKTTPARKPGRPRATSQTARKTSARASKATGRRGRPPGIPMSEETKAKIRATRARNKRRAARASK
jgi:hypothetical protein